MRFRLGVTFDVSGVLQRRPGRRGGGAAAGAERGGAAETAGGRRARPHLLPPVPAAASGPAPADRLARARHGQRPQPRYAHTAL